MSDNDRPPPNLPAELPKHEVTCTAHLGCFQCGGSGWLRQSLEGKMWSSMQPVACRCLHPVDEG